MHNNWKIIVGRMGVRHIGYKALRVSIQPREVIGVIMIMTAIEEDRRFHLPLLLVNFKW